MHGIANEPVREHALFFRRVRTVVSFDDHFREGGAVFHDEERRTHTHTYTERERERKVKEERNKKNQSFVFFRCVEFPREFPRKTMCSAEE